MSMMDVAEMPLPDSFPLSLLQDSSRSGSDPHSIGIKRRLSVDEYADTRPTKALKMSEVRRPENMTGIVYDPRMRLHFVPVHAEYIDKDTGEFNNSMPAHPEDPRRIAKMMLALEAADLVHHDKSDKDGSCYPRRISAREATDEELRRVHTEEHLQLVSRLKFLNEKQLQEYQDHRTHDSLYACTGTEHAAKLAAGGTIDLCKAIMKGEINNGFAVVRPPGHHAEPEGPRGFCWYNNVSIAVKALLADPELKCEKIMVIDWDIHHGNGIQAAHYDSSDVLYLSLHRNDPSFYPANHDWPTAEPDIHVVRDNLTYGDMDKLGAGKGHGYNINIPWTTADKGDGDYIYAFDQVVLPIAREYDPDIIIVASGFDAAIGDELGQCHVSDGCYAYLTHSLMGVCGKVAVVLEGGYNMLSISLSAVGVVKALLGKQLPRMANSLPSAVGVHDVDNVVATLKSRTNWREFKVRAQDPHMQPIPLGTREIIRQWEIAQLWDRYNLFPLYIEHEDIHSLYKDCVLANPGFGERAEPLLLIIHETNEPYMGARQITGEGHPLRAKRGFCDNDEVREGVKVASRRHFESAGSYIGDALKLGFNVIDIHLPIHHMAYEPPSASESPEAAATKLLTYVMEHYVKPSDTSEVYILATGIGHEAMTNWIMANEDYAMENVTNTFSFLLDSDPKRVRSNTVDGLTRWYYRTSHVFVKSAVLAESYNGTIDGGKPRRMFGRVKGGVNLESPRMWDLLKHHRPDVLDVLQVCPTRTIATDNDDTMEE